jgi:epoxyqueuosine reductase
MLTLSDLEALVDEGVRVGVTDLAPFLLERDRIVNSVAGGLNGGLGFTYASPEISTSPSTSFPWAASIVVVAVPYLADGDAVTDHRTVARFADGDRYTNVRRALGAIARALDDRGFRSETVFDDDRLVDRAVAVRAGVAWNGKSTMALTPLHGPWILIGSVVTDAPMEPTPAMLRSCGTCTACIPACPTGAILEQGVLDASRCLAAVLQRPGKIPDGLRKAVGSRIYGCDDCLTACPPGDRALMRVGVPGDQLTPVEVLEMSDRDIDDTFGHWYVPKRNMRFVRRNALVVLGNVGTDADLGVLAGYLGHPDSLLRGHAAWAVGTIGGSTALRVLEAALLRENDPTVVAELTSAIAATSTAPVYAETPKEPTNGSTELE